MEKRQTVKVDTTDLQRLLWTTVVKFYVEPSLLAKNKDQVTNIHGKEATCFETVHLIFFIQM